MGMWDVIVKDLEHPRKWILHNADPCGGYFDPKIGAFTCPRKMEASIRFDGCVKKNALCGDWKYMMGVYDDGWYAVPSSDGASSPDMSLEPQQVDYLFDIGMDK